MVCTLCDFHRKSEETPSRRKACVARESRKAQKTFSKVVDRRSESEYSSKCAVESGSDRRRTEPRKKNSLKVTKPDPC